MQQKQNTTIAISKKVALLLKNWDSRNSYNENLREILELIFDRDFEVIEK